ncbi:MAG: RNA-directed DNA polymerase [Candidatus Competibacteraceae bacterium]|nr:RNA-directed DNA polymerase [Candidatus Competibacteraceae bacterium]
MKNLMIKDKENILIQPGIFFYTHGYYSATHALDFIHSADSYKKISIPKRNGKIRTVYQPHPKLHAMQSTIKPFLHKVYFKICQKHGMISYEKRSHMSKQAWNRHIELRRRFPTIEDFADHIDELFDEYSDEADKRYGKENPNDKLHMSSMLLDFDYDFFCYKGIDPELSYKKTFKYYGSVVQHARNAVRKPYLFKCDIKDFYPSITDKKLYRILSSEPYNTYISPEIAALIVSVCTHRSRLVQGACTSPILANMFMIHADNFFSKNLKKSCTYNRYSRYVDDLIFASDQPIDAAEISKQISGYLSSMGLQLHPKKTRYLLPHQKKIVTGVVVNQKINIDRRYIRCIRAMLHDAEAQGIEHAALRHASGKHGKIEAIDPQYFLKRLQGMISWVQYVRSPHENNCQQLINRFNNLQKKWEQSKY